jgi:hypothetical protein
MKQLALNRSGLTAVVVFSLLLTGCESCTHESPPSADNPDDVREDGESNGTVKAPPCLESGSSGPADSVGELYSDCRDKSFCVEMHWSNSQANNQCERCRPDVDLKLLNTSEGNWSTEPAVASSENKRPDWSEYGSVSKTNDYRTSEAELISHSSPDTESTYRVGVHYQRATTPQSCEYREFDKTEVTVQIFNDGELVKSAEKTLRSEGVFWEVAEVSDSSNIKMTGETYSSFPP